MVLTPVAVAVARAVNRNFSGYLKSPLLELVRDLGALYYCSLLQALFAQDNIKES